MIRALFVSFYLNLNYHINNLTENCFTLVCFDEISEMDYIILFFRKSNSFELYTQDARAEVIRNTMMVIVSDHKIWTFKPEIMMATV